MAGPVDRSESRASLAADLVEYFLGNVDRHLGGDGQGDGVAGTAVNFDHFAVEADAQLGEVGMVLELADVDVAQFATEVVDDAGHQVVGQWPGRRQAAHPAVDAGRLENADDNGETA